MCIFNVLKYQNEKYFNNDSFLKSEVKKKLLLIILIAFVLQIRVT